MIITFCMLFQLLLGYTPPDLAQEMMRDNSFHPAWWCPGPHIQAIFANFYRPAPEPLSFTRKRIETYDGDFLDLDFLGSNSKTPLVVVLHGLEGSSRARYVKSLLGQIRRLDWRSCAVNLRGSSEEINRKKYGFHAGHTEDLDCVIRYLIEKKGEREIYLVGFSMGGNLVVKWLGENGENVPKEVKKAVVISVPFDLVITTSNLDQGLNHLIYTQRMIRTMKAKALARESRFPGSVDRQKVSAADTFREFDRDVTVRVYNLESTMTYWQNSSSIYFLDRVRVPTLVIHAFDDPFFPGRFLPWRTFQESNYLKLIVTRGGGHLGFVSGAWPWKQESWLEETTMKFLNKPATLE